MDGSLDYRRAYETAKRELAELMEEQERLERRKAALRKTIEALEAQCETEGVGIEPSEEAAYLRRHSSLADEIRMILLVSYPDWLRPLKVKTELEKLGHDLTKYSNPQPAIHMVLKRMVQSGEVFQQVMQEDGKAAYRCPTPINAMKLSQKAAGKIMEANRKVGKK